MLELVKSPYLNRQLLIDTNVANGTLEPIEWWFREPESNLQGLNSNATIEILDSALLSNGYELIINGQAITFGEFGDISLPKSNADIIFSLLSAIQNNPIISGKYDLDIFNNTSIELRAKKYGSKHDLIITQSGAAFSTFSQNCFDFFISHKWKDYKVILQIWFAGYDFMYLYPSNFTLLAQLSSNNTGTNLYKFDIADILNQVLTYTLPNWNLGQKFVSSSNQSLRYRVRAFEYYNGQIQGLPYFYDDCDFFAVKARANQLSTLFYFNWRRDINNNMFEVYPLTNYSRKFCHWSSLQWIYFCFNQWNGDNEFSLRVTMTFANGASTFFDDPNYVLPANNSKVCLVDVSPLLFDFAFYESAFTSELKSYSIQFFTDNGPVTKPVTYVMDNCNRCQTDIINLIYENTFGGFDTLTPLTFIEESIDVERVTTDQNNTFYTRRETTFKVDTGWIPYEFCDSFINLLESKQILMVSERYNNVKVLIKEGSFDVLKKHDINRMQFELIMIGEGSNG
jgi:hypothetical protein